MDRGVTTDQGSKPKKPSLFNRIFASCIPAHDDHNDPTKKRSKTPVPIIKTPANPQPGGPPLGPHPPIHGGGGTGPNPIPNPNPPIVGGPPLGGGGPGPNPIPNPNVPPKNPPIGGGGPGPNPNPNPNNPPQTGPIGGGGPGPNPIPIPPTASTGAPMIVPAPTINPVSDEDGQHSGVGGGTGSHSHDQPTSIAGPAGEPSTSGRGHSGILPALPIHMTNAGMHTGGHGHGHGDGIAGQFSGSAATGYGGNSGFSSSDGGGASSGGGGSGGGGGFGGASGI